MAKDPPSEYEMGKRWRSWGEDLQTRLITFIVTQDCQLRCRYCYMVGKNGGQRMDFETARKTIDYVLSHRRFFNDDAVVWDFIGGEPLLEIDLINRIVDYAKRRMYELEHPWFNAYRVSISTNGLLYCDPQVQEFFKRNCDHVSISITLDGTRKKHDLQRVYASGRGSYADVIRNIPLYLEQNCHATTKVTVGHEDLPYIKESLVHLWRLGMKTIAINCVFEDVWHDGDDQILEDQLRQLADHILKHRIWREYNCTFFSEDIGQPLDREKDNTNWCGTGKMLAVDASGNFYPCIRFAGYSLCNRPPRIVGNCHEGLDLNRLRPFLTLDRVTQSPAECMHCEVASGCAWCPGANYDFGEDNTIFQRFTAICKMHKARVRANQYYWERFRAMSERKGAKGTR